MTSVHDLVERRRARLEEIANDAINYQFFPPLDWFEEFGLSNNSWRDHLDEVDAFIDTHCAGASPAERGVARDEELAFRQELISSAQFIELRRTAHSKDADSQAPWTALSRGRFSIELDLAVRRAAGEQEWKKLQEYQAATRRNIRALSVFCPQRCRLVELYPRHDRFLVVAHAGHSTHAAFAAPIDQSGEGRLPISCKHGQGWFPLDHPTYARREGPPPRWRVDDLAAHLDGIAWQPVLAERGRGGSQSH